jgi:hypothetical protein
MWGICIHSDYCSALDVQHTTVNLSTRNKWQQQQPPPLVQPLHVQQAQMHKALSAIHACAAQISFITAGHCVNAHKAGVTE